MATIPEAFALAHQHHQAGRLQAAEELYRRILAVAPQQPDAWHRLGVIAHQVGKHELAIEYIGKAIGIHGTHADFFINMGHAHQAMQRTTEAAGCYRRAVELAPDSAEAHYRLGNAMMAQRALQQAASCFRRAVQLNPSYAEAHNNLGTVLKNLGQLDEAVACFRRVAQLRPNDLEPHYNLGGALRDQGMLDEAVACCRRAVEIKPDDAEAHSNLGNALADQGKLDEAVACHRRALALNPNLGEIHKGLGLALLLAGDWLRGWPEYEWRWRTKDLLPRGFPQPLWNGEPLAGKTILLHAEQGLGDTMQFIRYAALLKEEGATVIVECQRPLLPLLQGCPGVDQLVGQGDGLPAFAVHAPLLSVPGIRQTSPESVPARIPYLFARPDLLELWREKLRKFEGFKIGINWHGRPENLRGRFRSIPLRCFAPLAQIPAVRLISLQKGAGCEQLAAVRNLFPITELPGELDQQSGPFMDTAAVMKNLDLVITSDTAAAHLAGALGVPVWVALPFAPDWRWLLDRSDSPWYPTMRLFRQTSVGDWAGVFAQIEKALDAQFHPQL